MLNVDILFSLLEKRNLRQADLAKATGISTGNISDWKKGKSFPSAEKLVLIADYLGCSTDYLLGRSDSSQGCSNNHISNSTNIAFGENSSVEIREEEIKPKEKIVFKSSNFVFDKIPCPFCYQNFSAQMGNNFVELSVSPKECFQIFTRIGANSAATKLMEEMPVTNTYTIQLGTCSYCSKTHCKIFDVDRNKWTYIYPNNSFQELADKIPAEIYKDYSEAYATLHISPNASASLSRRCLQHMIRDRWNINCAKLDTEINSIPRENITKPERKALQTIRELGNIGAHPNEILEVPVEEAELMIKVIEIFLTKWYIDDPKDEELIADMNKAKSRIRKVDENGNI